MSDFHLFISPKPTKSCIIRVGWIELWISRRVALNERGWHACAHHFLKSLLAFTLDAANCSLGS